MNELGLKTERRSLRRLGLIGPCEVGAAALIATTLILGSSVGATPAWAQEKGKTAPAAAAAGAPKGKDSKEGKSSKAAGAGKGSEAQTSALQAKLQSGQEESILEALTVIAEARNPEHAPLVGAVLEQGSTTKVLVLALDTAGRLKAPTLGVRIAPYIRHRSSEVRHAAVRALVKAQGPHAAKALRQALRSSDPLVRNTAASGLGSLGAKDALDDLFKALANNVAEAAASIGQLCDPSSCEKLADLLGKAPFDIVTGGLEQALFRPTAEVPDATKIKIVVRLREVGTNESRRYLTDVKSRWPADGSAAVRQALDSAVKGAPAGGK